MAGDIRVETAFRVRASTALPDLAPEQRATMETTHDEIGTVGPRHLDKDDAITLSIGNYLGALLVDVFNPNTTANYARLRLERADAQTFDIYLLCNPGRLVFSFPLSVNTALVLLSVVLSTATLTNLGSDAAAADQPLVATLAGARDT